MGNRESNATGTLVTTGFNVSVINYLLNPTWIKVKEKDLTVEQCIFILKELIYRCKDYLPYFDGFTEIRYFAMFNVWGKKINYDKGTPSNPKTEIKYSRGITEKTRIQELFILDARKVVENFYIKEGLYLTFDGKIIIISLNYNYVQSDGYPVELSFVLADDEDLITLINRNFSVFPGSINNLHLSINSGIERRQQQLDKMKELGVNMSRIFNLIEIEEGTDS